MGKNFIIYFFIFVGGTIGSYIPTFWHDGFLSFWSIILSGVGSLFGIYVGYKVNKSIGG